MPANLENSAVATKVSFHSNPKKGSAKQGSNYQTIAFISYASMVMLQILQARLQQCMNQELPDVQTGLRKGRGTRNQIAKIHWVIEKAREFQKNSFFIDYSKAFVWITKKLWKILKEMGIPDHVTCLLRNIHAGQEATVRSLHGITDWFKIGKGVYTKALYCHPAYLNFMHSISCVSCEIRAGWISGCNQDCQEK